MCVFGWISSIDRSYVKPLAAFPHIDFVSVIALTTMLKLLFFLIDLYIYNAYTEKFTQCPF